MLDKQGVVQQIITTSIKDPYEITTDAAGDIIVANHEHNLANLQVLPDGGIYRIDRETAVQTKVASGAPFVTPLGVKVDSLTGQWIVADPDAFKLSSTVWGAVFRVDPMTGTKTVISKEGNFFYLQGLALSANGDIYVSDVGTPKKIIKVSPLDGTQTIIASANNLQFPVGLQVESDGNSLIVADALARKIISISLPSGAQRVLSSDPQFNQPTHITIEADGNYLVTDGKSTTGTRRLFRVDKGTGVATELSRNGFFEQPRGVITAK